MAKTSKGACLVVGVGDGVGSAIARAFAAEGYTVCMTRRPRHLDQLEALAAEIRAGGQDARAYGVDARQEAEMIALVDRSKPRSDRWRWWSSTSARTSASA
jgi:NAD(P)-dependent dehydrogenase (short-subunit alcohol dehydrogenase family)